MVKRLLSSLSRPAYLLCRYPLPPKMPPKRKRAGAPKEEASASDEKKAKSEGDWLEHGEELTKNLKPLFYRDNNVKGGDKIASFDIDETIISTASGKKFATSASDWKFWSEEVPKKLKSVSDDGYKIVFFTNQAGIEKKKTNAKDLKLKITNIIKKLGLDIQVFVSTGENHFRKPSTKVWEFMVEKCNQGVAVDMEKSYFVGDAAGRAKGWMAGKPKDFTCSDRKFAANIGITFYTPEEYFENQEAAPFSWNAESPTELIKEVGDTNYASLVFSGKTPELVLLIGPPASGKSTISEKYFAPKGYVVVSRDLMKTQEKCVKATGDALQSGKSVIVDNTNPTKEARAAFINLAKKSKCSVRCLWLQTSVELAHHLNLYRQTRSEGKQRRVPDVGYHMFKGKFEEPSLSEGFSNIEKVHFKPEFENEADEKLFYQWS